MLLTGKEKLERLRDGRVIYVAPKLAWASVARKLGVLAHEFGHILTARGFGVAGLRLACGDVDLGPCLHESPSNHLTNTARTTGHE